MQLFNGYTPEPKYFLLDNVRNKIVALRKSHITIVEKNKFETYFHFPGTTCLKTETKRSVGRAQSCYAVEILLFSIPSPSTVLLNAETVLIQKSKEVFPDEPLFISRAGFCLHTVGTQCSSGKLPTAKCPLTVTALRRCGIWNPSAEIPQCQFSVKNIVFR